MSLGFPIVICRECGLDNGKVCLGAFCSALFSTMSAEEASSGHSSLSSEERVQILSRLSVVGFWQDSQVSLCGFRASLKSRRQTELSQSISGALYAPFSTPLPSSLISARTLPLLLVALELACNPFNPTQLPSTATRFNTINQDPSAYHQQQRAHPKDWRDAKYGGYLD